MVETRIPRISFAADVSSAIIFSISKNHTPRFDEMEVPNAGNEPINGDQNQSNAGAACEACRNMKVDSRTISNLGARLTLDCR